MVASNAPFGLIPDYHNGGGSIRRYRIGSRVSGYNGIATNDTAVIYFGGLVKYATTGVITRAATNDTAIAGVFAGCEYDDATGRHQVRWWDAPTGATNIVAYVFRDPDIVYRVQADGAVAQSQIGNEANITASTTGSSSSGQSLATLGTGSLTNSSTAQLQVVEIPDLFDPTATTATGSINAPGDAFTICRVKISQNVWAANYNAF